MSSKALKTFRIREKHENELRRLFEEAPDVDISNIAVKMLKYPDKKFTYNDIRAIVKAHIRHDYTNYDKLRDTGIPESVARNSIKRRVNTIYNTWKGSVAY